MVVVVVAAAGSLWSLRIVQKLKLEQEPMKSIATTRWMDHLFFHSAEQEDLGCRFQSLELGCLPPPILSRQFMIQAYVLGFFCILHMLDNVHWIKISKSHTHIHTRMIHPLGLTFTSKRMFNRKLSYHHPQPASPNV